MPTLTSSQGALVAGCTPNDTIAVTVNSGAYSLEYPLGTLLVSGSTASATYVLGAGQFRLSTTGGVTYTLTSNPDAGSASVSWDPGSSQLYANGAPVSGVANMPQMLTVACGNSIAVQSQYGSIGSYWNTNGELHVANMLAGSPMRFGRMTATTRADLWGVYGYSGQTLATINSDIEAQWFAPMHTAGAVPQLAVGLALVENDLQVEGASFATIQKRLITWLRMVRRFPGVRILLCTPRPSFTINTAAKVAAWQATRDYMMSLDNGVDIFTARLDSYENPASPGTPLSGYTDASVHPNARGCMVNARQIGATLKRIARSFSAPFRVLSSNYVLTLAEN